MKRERALLDEMLFPNGKRKAFTMSYDDGTKYDRRLVEIMNRYHVRGTFNLNSAFLGQEVTQEGPHGPMDFSKVCAEEIPTLYRNHEVAGHGLNHASPIHIGTSAFLYETIEDKAALEQEVGQLVRGYAYPFGLFDAGTKEILRAAGYHYARAVETTGAFDVPTDFLEWKGTCHHSDPKLMELAATFCKEERFSLRKKLFYVWGHSYEFECDRTWDKIEELCAYMQEHGADVWFATNIEIFDYVTAYRSLEYSAEANLIYNPSAHTVWLKRGDAEYSIAPLATVALNV